MEKNFKDLDNLKEILEKARQLDAVALAILVKDFYPVIFRYFYYRTRTKEDAEDLTSEVFTRVVGSIKTQEGNFIAWLFQIARNLLIDYYRKQGRLKETSLDELDARLLLDSNENKRYILQIEDIKKFLNLLTDDQKEVITLKLIEGHSNEEVAQIMGKSIGAIKGLQFRALGTLRDILKKETKS